MNLVVSDTTPLNYLVLIEAQEVLPTLYGSILIPTQVVDELSHVRTPDLVRAWASDLPNWVSVRVGDPTRFPTLDMGEAAALSLAQDENGRLLVDELEARSIAEASGVPIIGTLGILAEAHLQNLLDFDIALKTLSGTNFRVHPSIVSIVRSNIHSRTTS